MLAALCAAVALLLGVTLRGLRSTDDASPREDARASGSSAASSPRRVVVPSTLADETPPWEVKPTTAASALPPGSVPAWKVAPPPPDPRTPPPPREPLNPAVHRPPMVRPTP
jgi:hypothetical protein